MEYIDILRIKIEFEIITYILMQEIIQHLFMSLLVMKRSQEKFKLIFIFVITWYFLF